MLGYGNLAALVNDPRANPRAWQQGNDVELGAGQAPAHHPGANCAVSPTVCVLLCITRLSRTDGIGVDGSLRWSSPNQPGECRARAARAGRCACIATLPMPGPVSTACHAAHVVVPQHTSILALSSF